MPLDRFNLLPAWTPEAERLYLRNAPDTTRDLTSRGVTLRAATIDEKTRSVEAVIATENPVEVYDWRSDQTIREVLLADGAELPDQLPMLAVHSRWSLDDVLGSVREIRVENGQVVGRLYFAEGDDAADRAWNKARQGHLRDVSVGYKTRETVDIPAGQVKTIAGRTFEAGAQRLRITTVWTPREASLVPVGADPAATTRNDPHPQENIMNPKLRAYLEKIGLRAEATEAEAQAFYRALSPDARTRADAAASDAPNPAAPSAPPAPEPPPAPPAQARDNSTGASDATATAQARAEGQRLERQRQAELREMAGADVPPEMLRQAIDEGWTPERASRQFLEAVRGARAPSVGSDAPAGHTRGHDQDCTLRAIAAGLLLRQGLPVVDEQATENVRRQQEQEAEQGHRFRNMAMPDICREALRMAGRNVPHDRTEMIRAAVSTAELSHIFTTSVNASLTVAFMAAPDTTVLWTTEEDRPNFMQAENITLGHMAGLKEHPRGGTAKHATRASSQETWKIARYSNQFTVDEMDIIDDRLGALSQMPTEMGEAAARLRPDLVYSILLANAALADTGALFNATAVTTAGGHANLGTGALASATLKAGVAAMAKQRDNYVPLNIRPKVLIIPPDLEFLGRELLTSASIQISYGADDETYMERGTRNVLLDLNLLPVVEGRIDATGVLDPRTDPPTARAGSATNWFLATDRRSVRVGFLAGTGRRPTVTSWRKNGEDGQWFVGFSVKHDIGATPDDFRGLYKSTGAG